MGITLQAQKRFILPSEATDDQGRSSPLKASLSEARANAVGKVHNSFVLQRALGLLECQPAVWGAQQLLQPDVWGAQQLLQPGL